MPSRVRIIAGPADRSWDHFIRDLVAQEGYDKERVYFGIETQERADEVRRKLRTAGRHVGVSVKAFWRECSGCRDGGTGCRYHVCFSAYDPEAARAYMERKAQLSRGQ